MSKDISSILEGWDFKPNEITVRKIKGDDGREKIQLRLDLGLLQMETEGRPDGKRPHNFPSYLEYYRALLQEHRQKYGTDENFKLDSEDCARLQQEAVQYYHRYLSLFQLGDYKGVERDTQRNLKVFDLVKKYAMNERDKLAFEQYRPYVIMMNTRAKGALCLEKKNYDEALQCVNQGIKAIKKFYREYDQSYLIETSVEIGFLKNWADEIRRNKPLSELEKLQKQLELAVAREEYEKAAVLRDQIKVLMGI